jgi:hypothetical protein
MISIDVTLTQLFILALATWESIEIWRHSELTAEARAYVEVAGNEFIKALARCAFCMAPWEAWVIIVAVDSSPWLLAWQDNGTYTYYIMRGVGYLLRTLILGLAVARLANLGNDLTHQWCRTPHDNKLNLDEDDHDGEETGDDGDDGDDVRRSSGRDPETGSPGDHDQAPGGAIG